jgi:hypothetical protein
MIVRHEVSTYQVLMISGHKGDGGNLIGFLYLYKLQSKYIGYIGIIKDGMPLPENTMWVNGVLNIYFHEAELVALLDTLRNERPIYIRYSPSLRTGSLGTDIEPVGEQEEPVSSV